MKFKASHILIVITILVLGTAALLFAINHQDPVLKDPAVHSPSSLSDGGLPERPSSDSRSYNEVLAGIEAARDRLASRYSQATTPAERAEIISQARNAMQDSIYTGIFPYWYGTAWDFNGTTEIPGNGKIACGYFVSTVLRHAGLRVERTRLAQQASEKIILSLTTEAHIKRFRRVPINEFVAAIREWGPGLYVVGLDIHTGFIVNTGDGVYFIHSSYIEPYAVVKERAEESKILAASKYRVVGRVSADDQLITKWLVGMELVTRTA